MCLISFFWMKGFELILHDTGQMIVDVIVRRAGLVIEQRRPDRDNVGVLLEHGARLLPAHVPHVDRLEVEVLGPVRLQTAGVAAGRVGHGGAAAGRHLPPGHAARRGLARPRVVGRVPVLQPEMVC